MIHSGHFSEVRTQKRPFYGVKSLPTLLLFDGQDFVQQISTSKLPAIQQMIDDYVTDNKSEDCKK